MTNLPNNYEKVALKKWKKKRNIWNKLNSWQPDFMATPTSTPFLLFKTGWNKAKPATFELPIDPST